MQSHDLDDLKSVNPVSVSIYSTVLWQFQFYYNCTIFSCSFIFSAVDLWLKIHCNRPHLIYQYSNLAARLLGQTSIFGGVFFISSLFWELRQKKLEKFTLLSWKPQSHEDIDISHMAYYIEILTTSDTGRHKTKCQCLCMMQNYSPPSNQ